MITPNSKQPFRAVIYARVSTRDQNTELQIRALEDLARARGWEISDRYVDEGVSGAKTSRPELNRLIDDVHARKIDAVLVWRLDRLARSLPHLIQLVDLFHAAGVEFVSHTDSIDTSTPAGRLAFHVFGAVAQFERELIRERVQAGIDRVMANGGIGRSGRRIGRPRAAVSDARIANLRADGKSLRTIAREVGLSPASVVRRLTEQEHHRARQ